MDAGDSQKARDAAELSRLGYAQELLREMGGFSSFALSFSIISILTGAITLYGHGLNYGGPLVMSVGWPICTVLTLCVAGSLAELASALPTAGALYHWASLLGGRGWGYLTAWLNTLGQFAITAGIDYGLAEFLAVTTSGSTDRARVLPLYAAILVSHAVLNHVGVRAVAVLNWLSAWYHVVGVVILVGALAVLAPHRQPEFLLTRFTSTEHPYVYAFLVGLLQAQWTFTGYDASAHVTEETLDPRRNAPWGMVLSVAVSGLFGWIMLGVLTLSIDDLPATAASDKPFITVLTGALGPTIGNALVWMVMGAMWFCGLSSVTSNSRMLYAFARDGGLPGSAVLARVSSRYGSPWVAVWVSAVAAFAVAIWSGAYSAMVALSTIALYASYGLPIALGLRARRSGRWPARGPWHLGRWSSLVNLVALAWIAVLTVLFVLPPNQLAGWTFGATLVVLTADWAFRMRRRFRGPPVVLAVNADGSVFLSPSATKSARDEERS